MQTMRARRFRGIRLLPLLVLVAAQPVLAQSFTYRVGSDAACDFATIQPAIDAAALHGGPDRISVATNGIYAAQALKIGAQDLEIFGGVGNCAQAEPNALTTISGLGGAADSVIEFSGAGERALRNLIIRDGDETNGGEGGGIDFEGSGTLTLSNVGVINNRAGYGGGISFKGIFILPATTLVLENEVIVQNNIANGSGGGIRMGGAAHLEMSGPRLALLFNKALGNDPDSGYGGGLQVLASSTANVRSSYTTFGVIAFNEAKYGGGLAVQTRFEDGVSEVSLAPRDPAIPVRLHDNVASVAGGALYIDVPDVFDDRYVGVCMSGFHLDHNQAPAGAAVFMQGPDYLSAQLFLNAGSCDLAAPSQPLCSGGVADCNRIDHNVAAQVSGQLTGGAVMELTKGSMTANSVAWTENVAADIVHGLDNFQTSVGNSIRNCLIATNTLSGQTIAISDDTTSIRNCTIAGNTLGLSTVMTITGKLDLQDMIIWQPGHFSLGSLHGTLSGGHIITNDPASLSPIIRAFDREPRFIDPALGDFRLRAASPAVDFAPAAAGSDIDLVGTIRDRDLPIPDEYGPRDLGAYERDTLAPLVLNGDMPATLRYWDEVRPGISTFDPTGGQAGNGGMAVNWEDPNSQSTFVRVTARQQCVFLPAPGIYRLFGAARTGGSLPPFAIQTAKLHWDLRRDGGDACTQGPVSTPESSGDLVITSGSSYAGAETDDEIFIAPSLWTPNSSLTISMVMQSSGITSTPRTQMLGWFDGIGLVLETNLMFEDGFE